MDLSKFELEIMQLFWEKPELTAIEIHEQIEKKRSVSYSTIRTIIGRLEKKGAVIRSRHIGRLIFYSPAIEAHQLKKPMINDFIKRVFLGDSAPVLAHIVQEEDLSLDDISYIESLLEQRKKELK